MKQNHEAVLARNYVHKIHYKLVLVVREVRLTEYRCKFELVWRHLVVSCLDRNPELVSCQLELAHECRNPSRDGRKIMVVELLVL